VRSLKLILLLMLATSLIVVGTGTTEASANTKSSRCSGGDLSGTYQSLRITGLCYVVNGSSVTVDGDLTVAPGAMLDGISPGGTALLGSALPGNLAVTGSIKVLKGAALLLGWCTEPNQGVGYENCDASKTGSADDTVGGSILAAKALAVIVHNVRVSGSINVSGGGGGVQCVTPALFSADTDPAINGSQSVGYDFSPVNYSDLESNTVGHSIRVVGLGACWFGALRDAVAKNFTFSNNTMSSSDGDEVVGNDIEGNMKCLGNSPAVQYGDSGSGPNLVDGKATGQCASVSAKG
jgi:hypothetical protein